MWWKLHLPLHRLLDLSPVIEAVAPQLFCFSPKLRGSEFSTLRGLGIPLWSGFTSTRGRSVFKRYSTTLTVILVNVALSLVLNLTPVWHAVLIRNGKVFSQLGPIGVCKLSHHIEGGMSCPETLYETAIHVSSWGQGWGSLDFCCVDLVSLWTKHLPVLQHIQKDSASHKSLECEGRECITSDEYVPIRRIYLALGAGLHQFPRVQQARGPCDRQATAK